MANISSIIKATSAIVKVSNKAGGSNKITTSSKIIKAPQGVSSNKKTGGGLIRRDSFALSKKIDKKSGSAFESFGLEENVRQIKVKVIKIDSLLKGTASLYKKFDKLRLRTNENKKRAENEDRLEKVPKTDKDIKKTPRIPGMGFLERILRFFMNMFFGWFALKFLEYLPLLLKIVKPLGYAVDWILDFSGKLLNGLVTFVDWGFKAYEFTRGAIKKIGGEKALQIFDKFSGAITTFMNLAIIAGMLSTLNGGGGGPGRGRGARPGGPRPGGGPRVTTSGGRPQGRPNIRNPFRDRPRVTQGQGGRGGGFRFPFGGGPRVTQGKGGGFKFPQLPKLPKLPPGISRVVGVLGKSLGYVALIPAVFDVVGAIREGRYKDAARTIITAGLSMAVFNLILGASGAAAVIGTIGSGGALTPVAIATLVGGGALATGGSVATSAASDALLKSLGLEDKPKQEFHGGGYVSAAGGGMISRAGQFFGGIKRGFGEITRRLSFTMPSVSDIIPGSKIGGQENIEKIFPNPKGKHVSPLGYLTDTGNLFAETDYLGPIFSVVTKSILGSKITNEDYRNIGLGMNAWIASGINDKKLKGGISPAFAEGGPVDSSAIPSAEDISEWAAESAKQLISPKVAESNKQLLKNVLMRDKHPAGIDDEMEEEPVEDPSLEVGPGGTVTGGNADFWALVAIASLESGTPQGRADVAQSIYNRLASGIYSGKSIKELIVSGNGQQYQPVGYAPREFRAISDKESAINAVMVAKKLSRSQAERFINDSASAIQNKDLQESARQFVGGRTDFWAEGLKPPSNGVGYVVRNGHRFGWFVGPAAIAYGKKNPGPASAPSLGDIVVMGGEGDSRPTGKTITWKEWGNYLKKIGFRPTENVFFGGLTASHSTPDHARNAMDAGYWKDNNYVAATQKYERKFKPLEGSSFSQILGPISDWKGHGEGRPGNTHLHFTAKKLNSKGEIPVTPTLQRIMSSYEKGGLAGAFGPEIALIGERGKEGVLDADTTAAIEKYAPGLLFSLNQGDRVGSIKALQKYASYESGAEQIIVVDTGSENVYGDDPDQRSHVIHSGGGSSGSEDPYEILERLPG